MKTAYLLFPILLILSCRSAEKKNQTVTISGTITNPVTNYVTVAGNKEFGPGVIDSLLVDENGGFLLAFAPVNPDGGFSMTFKIKEEDYFVFNYGNINQWLYLCPGDSMHLSINAEKPEEKIKFTGNGAVVNNYAADKNFLYKQIVPAEKELYSLKQDAFLLKIDSIKEQFLAKQKNYNDSTGRLTAAFLKKDSLNAFYAWVERRFNYPEYHNYYAPGDSVKPGDSYYDFINQMNLNDSQLFKNSYFTRSLYKMLYYRKEQEFKKDTALKSMDNAETAIRFRLAKELLPQIKIRNLVMVELLFGHIRNNGTYKMDEIISDFKRTCTNQEYIAIIDKLLSKTELFAEGKPALPFALPDINGDTVHFSDFKGKYVYVDVWATWCGPCKKELPFLEKLQEEYKGKNIVFISISVDRKRDAWEKMVKEKKMNGLQLYDGGKKPAIIEDYKISEIPRFMLFDREGKIITIHAPAPSGNIKYLLEKLHGI